MVSFLWELVKVAAYTTVHDTFSSSYPAVFRDLVVVGWVAFRIYRRSGGAAVKTYVEEGRDAAIVIVAAFVLVFFYHLVVTIPSEVRTTANRWPTPSIPTKIIANLTPPKFAYTPTPKTRDDSDPEYRGKLLVDVYEFAVGGDQAVANFTIQNIGKYRIVPTAMIKATIIPSRFLPTMEEEEKLFAKAADWRSGCVTMWNYFEPSGNKVYCHVTGGPWDPNDWNDIGTGRQGLYVLTRTLSRDTHGALPVTDTCRYFVGPDFNKPPHQCVDHNN